MKYGVILEPDTLKRLIRERRRTGGDRYDEVWDGVYFVSPLADRLHQHLAYYLTSGIGSAIGAPEHAEVLPGANISDRREDWRTNFRCPDVLVYLPGNPAEALATHWVGGPDFLIEVLSTRDRARKKLPFYASIGVREALFVNRKPWCLELYRNQNGTMELVGKSDLEQTAPLASAVLPMTFRLIPADLRPRIEMTSTLDARRWLA